MKYKAARKKKPGLRWNPDRIMRWMVACFYASLPFVVSFTGLEKFREPKTLFACLGIIAIGAVFLATRKISLQFRPRCWEFLLGLFVVYVGFHSLASPHPQVSLRAFYTLCFFVALLLVLKEILNLEFQRNLWFLLAAVSGVNAVLTVLQYFGLFPLLTTPTGETLTGRLNAAGLIGDVPTGSMLFGLCSLNMIYWIFNQKDSGRRPMAIGLLVVNLNGLLFTRSVTSLVAIAVCLGIWLVYHHWWHFRYHKGVQRPIMILWVFILVGVAGGALAAQRAGLVNRVDRVVSQMRQGDWNLATSGRQPVFLITWEMIQEGPILGNGLRSFPIDFFDYRTDTAFGRNQVLIDQPGAFRQVHNEYLQVWLELGLGGLLLFLILLAIPVARTFQIIKGSSDSESDYWLALQCLALVFIGIVSLAFFPFQVALGGALVALILGGLRSIQDPQRTALEESLSGRSGAIKLGLISVLVVFLGVPQVLRWRANNHMGLAAQLLSSPRAQSGNARLQRLVFSSALDEVERARDLCTQCYSLYDLRGSALFRLGRYREAVESYQIASFYLPSAEVLTNLGAAYAESRQMDQARIAFEKAIRYRPGYSPARQALQVLESRKP